MRARLVSIVVAVVIVGAILFSLNREERFVVENAHLERGANGVRVAGTLVNRGADAPYVAIEVSLIADDGRPASKEKVELKNLASGARTPFATALYPGEVKTYSIFVNAGRNPYGN
jgi:hypothetical protein